VTVDKAIEILTLRVESPFVRANPDTKDSMKLGIEALKRIKEARGYSRNWSTAYLPEETEG